MQATLMCYQAVQSKQKLSKIFSGFCLIGLFSFLPVLHVFSSSAFGNEPINSIDVSQLGEEVLVTDQIYVRSDNTLLGNAKEDEVVAVYLNSIEASFQDNQLAQWRRNSSTDLILEDDERIVWAGLILENRSDHVKELFVETKGLVAVAWFYRNSDDVLIRHYDDWFLPQSGRPIFDARPVVPLRFDPGERIRLVIQVFSQPNQVLNFVAWDPEAFREQRSLLGLLDGIYFGLALALVIYNLLLCLALRQIVYLFFAAFVTSSAALIYLGSGLYSMYGLQEYVWLGIPMVFATAGFVDLFSALFAITLLEIRKNHSRLFGVWLAVIGVNLANTILVVYLARSGSMSLDAISLSITSSTIATIFEQMVYLFTLVYFWRRSTIARYWFLAILAHVWMIIIWSLLTTSNAEPRYLVQFATLVDMILLSGMLAYNLRAEQKERHLAERANLQHLRLAQDLERSKSNFIATVGHDLHGPVRAISFFTESLRSSPSTDSKMALEKIDENLESITELLDSLVKMSRVESDANAPLLTAVSLAEVLYVLKSEFSPRVVQKGLVLEISTTDCYVHSHRICLGQIIRNLIENAVKYTAKGWIRVEVEEKENSVLLSVEDSGQGIPESDLDKVFDEFYQVNQVGATGVGLGLSIVARLTKLLDIQVAISSTLGEGTRIEMVIPRVSANQIESLDGGVDAGYSRPVDAAILVVGDSEAINPFQTMLDSWGAETRKVKAMAQADEFLAPDSDWIPDLLLTDSSCYLAECLGRVLRQTIVVAMENDQALPMTSSGTIDAVL
ncbi:MAG: sensor histidine kinase, partial [Pseudomonadales bacterium]|nr:sensor histidine kinase [Pseudomonadales bacterium]